MQGTIPQPYNKPCQINHEHAVKELREASVEPNPIRNDAKAIEMGINQYGMVVKDFAIAPAESGNTAPHCQVVHFTERLHRTVEAQRLDRLVIKFDPRH